MELQQANNLAKNTHVNVKKIAAKPKPTTFVTNAELSYLENDINDRGSAINLNVNAGAGGPGANDNLLTIDHGANRTGLSSAGSHRSNQSSRRFASPKSRSPVKG